MRRFIEPTPIPFKPPHDRTDPTPLASSQFVRIENRELLHAFSLSLPPPVRKLPLFPLPSPTAGNRSRATRFSSSRLLSSRSRATRFRNPTPTARKSSLPLLFDVPFSSSSLGKPQALHYTSLLHPAATASSVRKTPLSSPLDPLFSRAACEASPLSFAFAADRESRILLHPFADRAAPKHFHLAIPLRLRRPVRTNRRRKIPLHSTASLVRAAPSSVLCSEIPHSLLCFFARLPSRTKKKGSRPLSFHLFSQEEVVQNSHFACFVTETMNKRIT